MLRSFSWPLLLLSLSAWIGNGVDGQTACVNTTDCYPTLSRFDGTFDETIIACDGGECVCNLCFRVDSDGKCTLNDGCWTTQQTNEATTCSLMEYSLFSRVYGILFGISTILFFFPLLVGLFLILPSTICYRWCEKGKDPPSRFVWALLIALFAVFWFLAIVIFFAGLVLVISEQIGSQCLSLQPAEEAPMDDTM